MLLCRVACGTMFHVDHSDREGIKAAIVKDYDSVLGDREQSVNTYREFVVFKDEQIYPEYVILYEKDFSEPETEATTVVISGEECGL